MWVYAESSGDFRNPGLFFHLQEINIECFHLSSVQNVFKLPVRCVVQVSQQNYDTNILSLNMFLCSFQFILQEVLSRNWLCVLTAKLHKRHESLMFLVSFHDFAFFIKRLKYLWKACWINSQSARLLAKNTQRWEATAASSFLGERIQRCRPLDTGQIHAYQVSWLCLLRRFWVGYVSSKLLYMENAELAWPRFSRHGRKWSASAVSDSATTWTVAYQAPPSMGFSRQEYWSGLPFPSSIKYKSWEWKYTLKVIWSTDLIQEYLI